MKGVGMLFVSLRGVNFGFWSHLRCSGQNAVFLELGFRILIVSGMPDSLSRGPEFRISQAKLSGLGRCLNSSNVTRGISELT